jgi:glycosyltransferase involved in cell wall biosynthesis
MRILWVKVGGVWPLNAGGRIRSFHTIRELSERHSISVLTTHAPDVDPRDLLDKLPHAERLTSLPHAPPKRTSPKFALGLARSWLSPLPVDLWRWRVPELRAAAGIALASGEFDLCIADFLSAVPNLPSPPPVPVILFEHNVEHQIWRRLSKSAPRWQRPLLELEWRKLRRYERSACTGANQTIAVSERDRELLATIAPKASVRAISTGVDTDYFAPAVDRELDLSLAFVGSMDWYPNEDAALHLIDAILPIVRAEIRGAELTLVGRNPSRRLQAAAAQAGVRVTGTVDDVRPYIAEAAVLVVPLRVGGGTRLKIFEGLAMGKAIVSTTVGAEGLPLIPGEHYLRADHPRAFADMIIGLLGDPGRRLELGLAGRELVAERYSWSKVARAFEAHCEEALGTPSSGLGVRSR